MKSWSSFSKTFLNHECHYISCKFRRLSVSKTSFRYFKEISTIQYFISTLHRYFITCFYEIKHISILFILNQEKCHIIISVRINHIRHWFFTSFYHAKKHIIEAINIHVVGKNASERVHFFITLQARKFFSSSENKANPCFQWMSFPANIFLFKANNRNSRKRCDICSTLTIKTQERRDWCRSGVFIGTFEHTSHLFLVFLLLISNK